MAIVKTRTEYGDSIKKLRLSAGLRQADLAEKLGNGWTQADVSQLEANERVLTLDTALRIADIIGVKVEDIRNCGA